MRSPSYEMDGILGCPALIIRAAALQNTDNHIVLSVVREVQKQCTGAQSGQYHPTASREAKYNHAVYMSQAQAYTGTGLGWKYQSSLTSGSWLAVLEWGLAWVFGVFSEKG